MGIGPKKEQIPINIPPEKRAEFDALVRDITKRSQPMRENDRIRIEAVRKFKGTMPDELAHVLFDDICGEDEAVSHAAAMYSKVLKGDQVRQAIQRALKITIDETVLEVGFIICFEFNIIDDHYAVSIDMNSDCLDCIVEKCDKTPEETYVEIFRCESVPELETFLKSLSPLA